MQGEAAEILGPCFLTLRTPASRNGLSSKSALHLAKGFGCSSAVLTSVGTWARTGAGFWGRKPRADSGVAGNTGVQIHPAHQGMFFYRGGNILCTSNLCICVYTRCKVYTCAGTDIYAHGAPWMITVVVIILTAVFVLNVIIVYTIERERDRERDVHVCLARPAAPARPTRGDGGLRPQLAPTVHTVGAANNDNHNNADSSNN